MSQSHINERNNHLKHIIGPVLLFSRVIKLRLRLRDLRDDNDYSQKQIAEYLICDQSLYSKYEREVRALPTEVLVKLALFYNTSTDYLLGLTDEPKPYKRAK